MQKDAGEGLGALRVTILVLAAITMLAAAALFPHKAAMGFEEISKTFFGGVAIEGHDSTAYWSQGAPVEGSAAFTVTWKGAEWRFASAADRDAFAADPDRYAPRYGGHCANAMSLGKAVDGDPGIWRIFGQELFLFAAESGRARWDQGDVAALKAEADANWRRFTGQ